MADDWSHPISQDWQPVKLDVSVAHPARVWNYWLGGKDNHPADRKAADRILEIMPNMGAVARSARAFLGRAVRHLVAEEGVRQFLDIGTGLPTENNTHQIAQSIAPESRIVYVDNDPIVLVHARALLTGTPEGVTDYIDADVRDPDTILRLAANVLDFNKPIAVILMGILNFVEDTDETNQIVAKLLDAVPSGSYLVVDHPASDIAAEYVEVEEHWNEVSPARITMRTHAEVCRYFDGLELLEPGVVQMNLWRPDHADEPAENIPEYAGVGRKP